MEAILPEDGKTAAKEILEVIPLAMRLLAAKLRQVDPTLAPLHFRVLAHLYHGRWTLGDLARRVCVSAPTISRSISTLEERGWVSRVPSAKDGRVIYAELTGTGQEVLEEMQKHASQWMSSYLEALSADEREQLIRGMELLRGIFLEALEGEELPTSST